MKAGRLIVVVCGIEKKPELGDLFEWRLRLPGVPRVGDYIDVVDAGEGGAITNGHVLVDKVVWSENEVWVGGDLTWDGA